MTLRDLFKNINDGVKETFEVLSGVLSILLDTPIEELIGGIAIIIFIILFGASLLIFNEFLIKKAKEKIKNEVFLFFFNDDCFFCFTCFFYKICNLVLEFSIFIRKD